MRILIIEDNKTDLDLINRELKSMNNITFDHARDHSEFQKLYQPNKYAIILSDFNLPGKNGVEILKEIRSNKDRLPFIFISGELGEDNAIEILNEGATDYVSKHHLKKLPAVVQRAIKEMENEKAKQLALAELKQSEERYRSLIENMRESVMLCDPQGYLLYVNSQFSLLTGYDQKELVGKKFTDTVLSKSYESEFERGLEDRANGTSDQYEMEIVHKSGRKIFVKKSAAPVFEDGKFQASMSVITDITLQKKQEEQLRESENSFRSLFEQAGVGVAIIKTVTGKFIRINKKYCDLIGYSESEMKNLTFMQITHPNDLMADLNNMEKLISGEITGFSMEKRLINKDHSVLWVNLTVTPMWKPGESPTYHMGIIENITQRKQAEEELKLSYKELFHIERINNAVLKGKPTIEVLQELLSAMNSIAEVRSSRIYFYDKDKNVLKIVEDNLEDNILTAIEKKIGIKVNNVIPSLEGNSLFKRIIDERKIIITHDVEEVENILRAHTSNFLMQQLSTWARKFIGIKTFGILPIVEQEAIFGLITFTSPQILSAPVKNSISRFSKQAAAILAKKKAEDALEKSEEKFRRIFETIDDVYYQIDLNGVINMVSPSIYSVLGYRPEELIGQKVQDYYQDPDMRRPMLDGLGKAGRVNNYEVILKHKQGNGVHVSINVSLRYNLDGEAIGTQGILSDITRKKRQEEELLLKDQLLINIQDEERKRIAEELHDGLAQNLAALNFNIQTLKPEKEDDSRYEYFQAVSDLLQKSINECRAVSHIINPKELVEDGLIEGIIALFKRTEQLTNIKLELNYTEFKTKSISKNNEFIIYRTIQEALNNAIRHSSATKIELNMSSRREIVRISFNDNGKGIGEDILKKETSFRSLKSRLEVLNASYEIETKDGQGTHIFFEVPVAMLG